MVTALEVRYVAVNPVGVDGPLTAAPAPRATALAVTVPARGIWLVAPVTLAGGIFVDSVILVVLELAVVGVPVMGMVTTVLFVRTAVPAVSPGGKPDATKLAGVIVAA